MLHYFTPASQIPVPGKEQSWKMLQDFVGRPCVFLPIAQSSTQLHSHGVGVLLLGGGGRPEQWASQHRMPYVQHEHFHHSIFASWLACRQAVSAVALSGCSMEGHV